MEGVKTVVGRKRLDVKAMSEEERLEYIERKRELNRNHVKKHYYEVIKSDPERYQQFLEKCKKHNNVYYHNKISV